MHGQPVGITFIQCKQTAVKYAAIADRSSTGERKKWQYIMFICLQNQI